MTIDELLTAYEHLRIDHGLPLMRSEQVEITPIPVQADPLDSTAGADRLAGIISAFGPSEGWLCYQSAVLVFPPGGLPGPDSARGLLLSGELANADREGLHIRQDGRGGWIVTRFTPGQGGHYLVDDCSFVTHEPRPGDNKPLRSLCYRRYWTTDEHHCIRQAAACFIGFDGGN